MTMTRTPVPHASVQPGNGIGSSAQRERRRRILDATITLAERGGYEAVQMRSVADLAEVALGTLYRYFPSKTHLLVGTLTRELDRISAGAASMTIPGRTPYARSMFILGGITRRMQRSPLLTEALTRAVMFADASVAAEVDASYLVMDRMLARAISAGEPSAEQFAVAQVIRDVWLANLMAWVTRRATTRDLTHRLDLAVTLLLGHGNRDGAVAAPTAAAQ